MDWSVLLSNDAVRDLKELYNYIAKNDSPAKATQLVTKLEQLVNNLSQNPERGVYPQELSVLGIHTYREIFFKPYRIIYRVYPDTVVVMLVSDGRRDMQTLLEQRLLAG